MRTFRMRTLLDSQRSWVKGGRCQILLVLPEGTMKRKSLLTSDSLKQHLMRANYQAHVWRKALYSMQNLPPATQHGWRVEDGALLPVLMTKAPAPQGLLELTVCNCKKSACNRADCACKRIDMPCTEAGACMAQEMCQRCARHCC